MELSPRLIVIKKVINSLMSEQEVKVDINGNLEDRSHKTKLIFLIGFMGCGKTTLGRKLAMRLGYHFIDLDQVLETQEGMTIAVYFSTFGEEAFRIIESKILKQTHNPEHLVIATGGGLPCFFDNMHWMNDNGKTVYLKLSPKTLADRLENENAERPLLNDKQGEALVAFIKDKLTEREVFYNQATIIADGLNLTAKKVEHLLKVNANG